MIKLSGNAMSKIDRSDGRYQALLEVHSRLAKKDSTIWGTSAQTEAAMRMNWIDLPESSRELLFKELISKMGVSNGSFT